MMQRNHSESSPFSLQKDKWSFQTNEGYITSLLYFIDSNWKMRTTLLDLKCFETPPAGNVITTLFENINFFEIWVKNEFY